jgi:hypothetical protein
MKGTVLHRPIVLLGAVLVLALSLGACETPVEGRKFPQISFSHQAPIRLDVAQIDITKPPMQNLSKDNIEHELPVSLNKAAEIWARERLKPVGNRGVAVVSIEKASFTETQLKRTAGIKGAFTTDQSERYIADLRMSVKISDLRGEGVARAEGSRKQTVREDITLAEREKVWFRMVEGLIRDLDKELEKQMRAYLGQFIR